MHEELKQATDSTFEKIDSILDRYKPEIKVQEVGRVVYIGHGIAHVKGLKGVKSEELIQFQEGLLGLAFNIDREETGVIFLGDSEYIEAGSEVHRTGRALDIPVGDNLKGRVIDSMGNPLDNLGPIRSTERCPVEQEAPPILDRAPVNEPLQTGIKVIDALIPVGRGQRELILGDRQTGKTAVAVDTIINQRDKNVICIYCAIGQRSTAVAKVIADLHKYNAMEYTTVVVTTGENTPGLQFAAPYAATSIAEYFMRKGMDTLVIYDDLTRHARAYRELSLLLRRPPGREAYPGDIFYIHSRLLERSTHLINELGGGSLTALPIIETEAQNISAYIPTNLISITDGQIYLSPELFQKGILPPVNVGKSVSRVGGKTQLPAYNTVAGDLRLTYSQFEELETFARFGTRLDVDTQKSIERGKRVREILKQAQYDPVPPEEQIAVILSVNQGLMDDIEISSIPDAEVLVRNATREKCTDIFHRIISGEKLTSDDMQRIHKVVWEALENAGYKK